MRAALITGAGARLGRAMAITLAGRGLDVAVHYSSSETGARETAAACEALGVKAVTVKADLLDPDAVARLVPDACAALGGPLDVLVNNASIFEYDHVTDATAESWDRAINSNLRAPFFLTQAFAAQAPEARTDENGEPVATGLVVNMLDQRLRKLTPHFASYTIAKAGLWTLTQTAARALAPRIRVNGIAPGPTLQGANQSDEAYAHERTNTVLGRGADPDDITAALAYLLDAKAVTGQMIAVDGGQHLGWQTPEVSGRD